MKTTNELSVDPNEMLPTVEKMLYNLAWKFHSMYGWPFDEALSEAYAGFMKACRIYRPGKGMKFSSYCYLAVWGFLKSESMKRAKSAKNMPLVEIDEQVCGETPEISNPHLLMMTEHVRRGSLQQTFATLLSECPRELHDITSSLSEDAQELFFLFWNSPGEIARMRARADQVKAACALHAQQRSQERTAAAFAELRITMAQAFA